jgi:two-component system, cell cycle sensor histidine kinase and response regulator CckA
MEKTETQLQQASQKEAVNATAYGMIHDINNILSSILGFAELAKIGLRSGVAVEKDLVEVVNAGLRARDLVSRLLVFVRHADTRRIPIDVVVLIKETLKLLRAMMPTSIEISFHPGEFKGRILSDPVQFQHILIIVCSNVSHAMKKKTGQIEIGLKYINHDDKNDQRNIDLEPGKYLQLGITGRTNGMPSEILERNYVPLSTPEYSESANPGLFLVQDMVGEMNGAISVWKKPGKGIIFHILFPKNETESDG